MSELDNDKRGPFWQWSESEPLKKALEALFHRGKFSWLMTYRPCQTPVESCEGRP